MVARFSSAHRPPRLAGGGWRGFPAAILRSTGRLWGLLRTDFTAILLVIANIVPVIDLVRTGEPVGTILIIYWMQLIIIGFWNVIKLIVVTRLGALLYVPMFVVTYMSIVIFFGFIAGGLLDDQVQGTAWQKNFSPWNYWVPAAIFFAVHGISFAVNFIGRREYEHSNWEKQVFQPFFRAMPMWLAAVVGAVFGSFFNNAAFAVVFVLPVKVALDLVGHFAEHGMLAKSDDIEQTGRLRELGRGQPRPLV